MKTSSRMFYRQPARAWTEAFPLGNGRLGAMAWMGYPLDRVDLNEDSLWSGFPVKERRAKDPIGAQEKAREALEKGEFAKAQEIMETDFTSDFSQAYMPLGKLSLEFEDRGEARNYERFLDLFTGVAGCEYEAGGVRFLREIFASHPAQSVVYRISADQAGGVSCRISVSSLLRSTVSAEEGKLILSGECPGCARPNYTGEENPIRYYEEPEKRGVAFESAFRILTGGGDVLFENGECRVSGADWVEIRFFARTSFAGPFRHPHLDGLNADEDLKNDMLRFENASYAELLCTHKSDFSPLMERVRFALQKRDDSAIPTDERLLRFQTTRNDPVLYELIFNFGRYLMVSGSRPGTRALNLQGIWNDSVLPPWSSNYTININTEMNYWASESCQLSEMAEPLFELVDALRVSGERIARDFYHARGSVSHHNSDLWAKANPVGEGKPGCGAWAPWQMSFGWLCRHLYDHYLYTLDTEFLMNTALPCLKAAARFYLDILTEVDGEWTVSPTTSPENTYLVDGKRQNIARAAAMTDAIVRETLQNTRDALKTVSPDDPMLSEIEKALPGIRGFKIGSEGQLLEWDREYGEAEPNHRHTSHLYALHPGHMITPEKTPELTEACKKTLLRRGDGGTGWSLGWKINFWARLNDGDHALTLLKNQLRFVPSVKGEIGYGNGGGTYLNLFDAHPPFQIDGNFGATAGIAEMLLRSETDCVFLLPALPTEWADGEICGLCAMNDMRVDIFFAGGQLKRARIDARKNPLSPVSVKSAGRTLMVIREKGVYEYKREKETTC